MTTGRFCAQCGKDTGGAAFCPYCGVTQAAAAPPAQTPDPSPPPPVLNAFCPSCGTKAEPGLAFCTKCGANLATGVPLAPSQHVHAAGKASQTPIYVGVGAVVVAVIIAVMVMSGGGDDSGSSSSSSSGSNQATGSSSGASPSTPTVNRAQPIATASSGNAQVSGIKGRSTVGDIPVVDVAQLPKNQMSPGKGNNPLAANAMKQSLQQGGLNLAGMDVFVVGVPGTRDSVLMLVVQDAAKAPAFAPNAPSPDGTKLFGAIANSPAVKEFSIQMLSFNVTGADAKGPYSSVATVPMTLVDVFAKGTQPTAAQLKQVKFKEQRGTGR